MHRADRPVRVSQIGTGVKPNAAILEAWMHHALELAERGRGFVEPNPMVGAVVLDAQGNKVGEGWHRKFGEAHAEVNAFADSGHLARGGTLIVTLEPCCHHGKTPPCTDAVLAAGVKHVVAAMADPFAKVAGGGIAQLRQAGINVDVGLCEHEALRLNAPYLKLVRTGQPWVHLKWAMTLDGRIATRASDSKWISGEESRRLVHEIRGRMDAILVGRGTAALDDPLLTARPPGPRTATRVIVTASGNLPDVCQLRGTARQVPVLIFTSPAGADRLAAWAKDGAEIQMCALHGDQLPVGEILNELGRRRMTNILVEGGAGLLGSFLDERAGDEAHVFIAPKLIGGEAARSPIHGTGVATMAEAMTFENGAWTSLGADLYWRGRIHEPGG